MLNKENMIAMQSTEHAMRVFQSCIELNAMGLKAIIQKTEAETSGEINAINHVALGVAVVGMAEFAEQNYAQACAEFGDSLIVIDYGDDFNSHANNHLVYGNVKDTLSNICNALQVASSAALSGVDDEGISVATPTLGELKGLYTMLQGVGAAAMICVQSIDEEKKCLASIAEAKKSKKKRKRNKKAKN